MRRPADFLLRLYLLAWPVADGLLRRGTVIKGAIVFQLVMWAIPSPRTRQEGDGGHKEEEGEPRFFPFPLTTVRHPPQPYAGSDPEWREFIRISRDRALQQEMRGGSALSVPHILSAADKVPLRPHRQPCADGCPSKSRLRHDVWPGRPDQEILAGYRLSLQSTTSV